MKYLLTKFIRSMRVEEVRYYKIFNTNYLQKGKEKRTIELFDALYHKKPDEYDIELIEQFFSEKRRNSYYRLKNRLLHDLEHSLVTFHLEKDEEFAILNKIKLASIFLQRTAYEQAQYYLEEAEKLAVKHQAYNLLNVIYDKFIHLCSLNYALNPAPYLERKQAMQTKYEQVQQSERLLAMISYQLHRSNFSNREEDVVETLEQIQQKIQLSDNEHLSAELRLKIHRCARNILLQKREFEALGEYLERSYEEFERVGIFNKKNHEDKIIILIWIANTSIKSRSIKKIAQSVNKLEINLNQSTEPLQDKYLWLFYQSKMMVNIIQGTPDVAVRMLESLLNTPHYQKILSYFSVYVNLSMLNYYCQNSDKSLEHLGNVIISKDYKNISRPWQLNISIVELMLRYETEDYEYATHRYKELRRKYRKELAQKGYEEQKQFLEILRDILNKPDALKTSRTRQKVERFVETYTHFEIGANELLNYSVWLKSKLQRKPYYEVMLAAYYEE